MGTNSMVAGEEHHCTIRNPSIETNLVWRLRLTKAEAAIDPVLPSKSLSPWTKMCPSNF
jgi:hypothetical protein